MAFWTVISAAASLIAGWYGRDVVDLIRTKSRARRTLHHQKRMAQQRDAALNWVATYYEAPDNHLVRLSNGRTLSYLSRPEWRFPLLRHDDVRFVCGDMSSRAPVDQRNIRNRRRQGQRVWDGDVLYLRDGISHDAAGFRIDLCRGTYFQYASLVDSLTREAAACARSQRRRPATRDAVAGSLGDLVAGRPQAQLLGFAVALVFATPDGYEVMVQRRSFETGVAADLYALVPAFVVELSEEFGRTSVSPLQDFFREMSEELYSIDHQGDERQVRRDWYLRNEDVKRLMRLHEGGQLVFEIVGFGFDALTTEMHFAAVALFENPDTARDELRRMAINWEAVGVRTIDIDSPEVQDLLDSPSMYPTSAFALSCARDWLTARSHQSGQDGLVVRPVGDGATAG